MNVDSADHHALDSCELDWYGLLAALTELVGRPCTARVYSSQTSAPLAELRGPFSRVFEPFELGRSAMFLLVGPSSLVLEAGEFLSGTRDLERLPRIPGAVLMVTIHLRSGAVLEIEADRDASA